MKIALRLSGVDGETLRRLLAACSQNRESFAEGDDIWGSPRWAPRVHCEGPDLFAVHITPCPPSLAALLATIADGAS